MDENIDYVICPICQGKMKELSQHIKKSHNMTKEEFILLYPNHKFICEKLRISRSYGNKISEEKRKISIENKQSDTINKYNCNPKKCLECSTIIPYEKRENDFCNSHCSGLFNNKKRIENGFIMSDETKQKISISLKGKNYHNGISRPKKILLRKEVKCVVCGTIMSLQPSNKKLTCCYKCQMIRQSAIMVEKCKTRVNRNHWKCVRYDSKYYGNIHLDSTWESKLVADMEFNNIKWEKSKYFKWIDETGKTRSYFPDFYLPDYNIYLDPKNPYLAKLDEFKINQVIKNHNIKLFIITKEKDLTWNYVKSLIDGAASGA